MICFKTSADIEYPMIMEGLEHKGKRAWIDGLKSNARHHAFQFCEEFDIAANLKLDLFPVLVFREYFAAYYLQKCPLSVSLDRLVRHPMADTFLRIPVLDRLVSLAIDQRDSYTMAAQELMDEAQKIAVLSKKISTEVFPALVFQKILLDPLLELSDEEQHKPTEEIDLSGMIKVLTVEDPDSIQMAAHLLSSVYFNEGISLEDRTRTIAEMLGNFNLSGGSR